MISPKSEMELKQRYDEIFDKSLKPKRVKAFWKDLGVEEVIA